MKRISILFVLFLCSCSVNSELSKTCKYEVKNSIFNEKTVMEIKFNGDDVVEEAVITKTYEPIDDDEVILDIKSSIDEYNKKYGGTGIKYNVLKDDKEYVVQYFIPVSKVKEDLLKDFKLRKNSTKLFRDLKKNNIECGE